MESDSGAGIELDTENSKSFYYGRDVSLIEYGLYYGATSLFKINKQGLFTEETDYSFKPVDAVDDFARSHDIRYGAVNASGVSGLTLDWATTPADRKAIQDWQSILDLGVGATDPYNGQPISQDEYDRARSGILGFKVISGRKKDAIKTFMLYQKDDFESIGRGKDPYQEFLDTYMEKSHENGVDAYRKKEGFWEMDKKGHSVQGGKPLNFKDVQSKYKERP